MKEYFANIIIVHEVPFNESGCKNLEMNFHVLLD